MPLHVLELFRKLIAGTSVEKVVALGASYKANVGDDRESPSVEVAELIRELGINVAVHDPYVEQYACPLDALLSGADALVLLTDHRDYSALDPVVVGSLMKQRLVLDTRGVLDVNVWEAAGFRIIQLGTSPLSRKHMARI
jgi:UDP-N-acetyl-D-mannosaminuronic acid dehydrogenase